MSLLAVAVTSGEIFVPLLLQALHHQSPLVASYLAALMGAGWTLGSVASSGASGAGIRRANRAGLTEPGGVAGMISAAGWLFGVCALAPVIGLFIALPVIRFRPS